MNYILFETALNFISRLFSLLFGILTPIITVMVTLITCIDLLYLLLPTAGEVLDRTFDGKRFGGFRLMSKDALTARERQQNEMKNAAYEYLKLRAKTYIWVALIFYVVLGILPQLLQVFLDYVMLILEKVGFLWG